MKEIPFRWIDKYLIHLKIQEKFYLLFLLPLIALLILTLVLDNAADAMLNHLYQDELILMKNFIEAGNLSRSQVMDILASSNTIALGSGAGSVSVLNGSFNLVATHEQDLWTALSSVHWTVISVSLYCCTRGLLHYDVHWWRDVHNEQSIEYACQW